MAKKVFMIAPFEAMTGNLSGDQKLEYAENNNPAYEAPNGTQYARNYKTRYVGARRGKDGLVYFQVKQTSAAVLNNKTRLAMGLTGVTQACWASVTPATREQVAAIVASLRALDPDNPEYASTAKCWNARCRRMLQYKESQFVIAGPAGNFTFKNPFDLENPNANAIATYIWVKFVDLFVYSSEPDMIGHIVVDNKTFVVALDVWSGLKGYYTNTNYLAALSDFTLTEGANARPQYRGQDIYLGDVKQLADTTIVDGSEYTTIVPQS